MWNHEVVRGNAVTYFLNLEGGTVAALGNPLSQSTFIYIFGIRDDELFLTGRCFFLIFWY